MRKCRCLPSTRLAVNGNLQIYAKGSHVTVKLNGQVTVHMVNDKFKEGPFSLQFAGGANGAPGGPIKWRKVQLRPL